MLLFFFFFFFVAFSVLFEFSLVFSFFFSFFPLLFFLPHKLRKKDINIPLPPFNPHPFPRFFH